ncbi:MAG: TrkA C-terminal domain-containing protein [Planctomycetota bacterium]
MSDLLVRLNEWPIAGYCLVVALGFTLGRISIRGIALGPAAGTIIVALLFGRAGVSIAEMYGGTIPKLTLGDFGFALFIYSVGFEAGPRFFGSLRHREGWQFVFLGLLVNVLAIGLTVLLARTFEFDSSTAAGTLAGALTSAPTYAAASEIAPQEAQLSVAFAITYPIGIAAVVLMVELVPRLLRYRLTDPDEEDELAPVGGPEMLRAFDVKFDTVIGKSLAEMGLPRRTGCTVTRVHRGTQVFVPDALTKLEAGDHLMVRGTVAALHRFEKWVGPEIYDVELRRRMPSARAILVQSSQVVGKTLVELDLIRRFHCLIVRVVRGGVEMEPNAETRLARDDIVHVSGGRDDVRRFATFVGRFERSTNETDVAVYAAGIVLGVLLGRLSLDFGAFHVTLGIAGGLLLSGLLLGRFRRIGPLRSHVPAAARQLVRDLGVLLFVCEAGLFAGDSAGSMFEVPWTTILACGLAITVVPMGISIAVGRHLLRMRPVDVWGSVCGGMTSSAALTALRRAADSDAPAISYAASFAVASVVLTLAGPLIVVLVGG